MKFTIGCDPEIFLMLPDGLHVPAIGLIGGSKTEPRPLDDTGNAILEDNVAVEFNTAPAHDPVAFRDSIRHVMDEIKKIIPEELSFSMESAVSFRPDFLMSPQAMEFGCEPDFNAWTKEVNPRPNAEDNTLRSCGGHVHVGFSDLDPIAVIRAMDLFLGVPSISLDKGTLRRKLYGKAGSYRPKPYGAEYRTLSNFWIFKDELIQWVYDQTEKALDFVSSGETINDVNGEHIRRAINNNDAHSLTYLNKAYRLG